MTIGEKLDKIYETKLQIKSAIGTDSDVFEDYPEMIRNMSPGGGGEVSYAYLEAYYVSDTELQTYLGNYVSYSYAYNNYVSYSYLGDLEEITYYILGSGSSSAPENVYATKTELASYVSKDELNDASYITSDIKELTGPLYITYQETNNTRYGLKSYSHIVAGDENKTVPAFIASKRYCTNGIGSYVNMASFFVNSDGRAKFAHKASAGGGGDDSFMCFNAYGFKVAYSGVAGTAATTEYEVLHEGNIGNYITSIDENIIPKENNTYTLGNASYLYSASYITDLWTGTKNRISNRSDNQINIQLNNGWKYTFHSNGFSCAASGMDLGNVTPWRSTYTSYIYTDDVYISNSTYLPVATYWYDGSTYHWLGDLFN